MKKTFILLAIAFLVGALTISASAQKAKLGKVCGNPNVACRGAEGFQPHELVFEMPRNSNIYESKFFYAVILKSIRMTPNSDCGNLISERERLETQSLFSTNKVFALKCSEAGDINYTNIANSVSFMAVYAGDTLAAAQKFLKTVQGTGKFGKVNIRKMQAFVNGT